MERGLLRVSSDVSIVAPYPALYVHSLSALLMSDLHLGLEEDVESKGVALPVDVYPEVREMVLNSIKTSGARRFIVLGDLKHEFGGRLYSEYVEVRDLVNLVKSLGVEMCLVRGNHDNFIIPVLKAMGVAVVDDALRVSGYCLTHGHDDIELNGCRVVVMGHEHPTVTLRDESGVKLRFKAFIRGRMGPIEVYVLPSVNPLAHGTPINEITADELLSPMLRKTDIDSFEVYVLDPGVGVMKFPRVGLLRALHT